MYPLTNSALWMSARVAFPARQLQHLVSHIDADHPARRPDPPGADEHIGPSARAQIDNDLAGVKISDRSWDAASERQHSKFSYVGFAAVVEGRTKDLTAHAVRCGNFLAAAFALASAGVCLGRCSGVPLPDHLAKFCVAQLSHALSSSRAPGMT